MQGVWGSNSRQVINVTGVMAMAIGHINAQHLRDKADKVEDNAEDVVRGKQTEETEMEVDEDRKAGWPCWCNRNQLLQMLHCNQHL